MSTVAWVVLVLICGFVWGGFGLLLARALRSERWKRDKAAEEAGAERRTPPR